VTWLPARPASAPPDPLCPNKRAGTAAGHFGHKAGVGVDTDGMNGPVVLPQSIEETLAALQEAPEATILAGGTDLMVAVNAGTHRPESVVSLARVNELRRWQRDGDDVVVGACVTYTEMEHGELAALVPALCQAARTIGSPQIRNAATIGGNLGTASPAGDTLPVLAALDAVVEIRGPSGTRSVPVLEFVTGVKKTVLEPGELVTAVRLPVLRGPQEFLKVGTRNAMVISVVMAALVVDLDGHTVRLGLGSVAPVPVRAREAEAFLQGHLDWNGAGDGRPGVTDASAFARFGELAATATAPIDDHRSTAAYRRHAVSVCARRAVERAFT
jgi:CO/xanthine dehydrogenase FAD-binding subunit